MNIDESKYKVDLEILSKHQGFTSEILRLSLLGIAVFGALLELEGFDFERIEEYVIVSLAFFGASTACSLAHRYFSNSGFEHHIRYLRKGDGKYKVSRNNLYNISGYFMAASCILFAVGSLVLVLSFILGASSNT